MKTITFINAVKKLGYTIIKYNKGYNYRSVFATDKDGQMWYFNIEDLRDDSPMIYRRKVRDENDYHGEVNRFDVEEKLEELGYRVLERRQKCDYNSL